MNGELLYCNSKLSDEIEEKEIKKALQQNLELFVADSVSNLGIFIPTKNGRESRYEIKSIITNQTEPAYILSYLIDVTEKWQNEKKLERIAKLQDLILNVTRTLFSLEALSDIYETILETSFQALDKATLGSILVLEGEQLVVAAYRGFPDSISRFVLPLVDSFLYQETNGRLDKAIYIQDLTGRPGYQPIKTDRGDEKLIRSTISTPIFINGKFFGMINIDSKEPNAFDETDKSAMEFLKYNIEFALTNHFLYLEKAALAKLDSLTGLYNRRTFDEFFNQAIERAARYNEKFCVVLIDIDALKKVNDEQGHLTGDKVITMIADVLSEDTRKSDLLARIGGDEFAGIYLETTSQDLETKYEMLHKRCVFDGYDNDNSKPQCNFSYGIASYPVDGVTTEELIRTADVRMYKMKNRSK